MELRLLGLFPGQGSQKVGMGKSLFDHTEIGKSFFAKADKALGFNLSTICFEGPAEKLMSTAITQPAILTVSVIAYFLARELRPELSLACAAGHSLGEYSALVAAGAISFEDAVLLVHKRGSYMQEAVPQGKGKMVAVLGKEVSEVEGALSKVSSGIAQVANINSPGQIVVAGDKAAVDEFLTHLGGAKSIELPVSAPFHCELMKPAEEKLSKDLASLSLNNASFPVYSNYHAKGLQDANEIREALRLQVCGRVRWVESMENAVKEHGITTAIEYGEGSVLSGLMKRINPKITRSNVDSLESVQKALTA